MTSHTAAEAKQRSREVFHLPDVGEGLTEAEIVRWQVKVGDEVAINDPIVEIETAKSLVELPSPLAGTVLSILADEGTTVAVGSGLITIGVPDAPAHADIPSGNGLPAAEDPSPSVLVGYGPTGGAAPRRRKRRNGVESSRREAAAPSATVGGGKVLATPPVRKLARERGVDLSSVPGTGPHGRTTRDDVLAAASAGDLPTASDQSKHSVEQQHGAPVELEQRIPIKGVRKFTAKAMVDSAFTAPHVTEFMTVDVTETMELLAQLKTNPRFVGIKLTPLVLLSRALVAAVRNNPTLNSSWDEKNGEIVIKKYINLGIAVASDRGLVVPNIKHAESMNLAELATSIEKLTTIAREGKTPPADLQSGTITITNVGVFGVDTATPILNPGEAAILCFGAIRKQPWVHDDRIEIRSITTLGISFDHRLVDGAEGSRLLYDLAQILEDPRNFFALA